MSYETIMLITNIALVVLLGCLTACAVALTIVGIKELFR